MDYGQCWDLQRAEFDAMTAAKSRGTADGHSAGSHSDSRRDDRCRTARTEVAEPQSGLCDGGKAGSYGEKSGLRDDERAGTLFLVEHPPVYTLGKHGKIGNLLVGEERLRASGAEFYRIDRGGDITFHGEGQIVGYPILDLERIGIGLREYIAALEQSVIDTVAEYGIRAGRLGGASGVWLGEGADFSGAAPEERAAAGTNLDGADFARPNGGNDDNGGRLRRWTAATDGCGRLRKICAIGVRASRFITMHGFALNVSTDLKRFDIINPCGFTDKGATSMARELGYAPDIEEVKRKLTEHLSENLNVKIYKN